MKKFLTIIICLVLVVGIGVGAYFLFSPKQEAAAVMTLETNPSIQLVLDQNDKVMSVNAINEDGESLMLNVNFVGKTAEEAAKLFAEMATKSDMLANDKVTITIACEDEASEKYTELKNKVKNSVNNYFKEIGVMAGAIVNISEDIQAEIEKLGYDVSNYANKTYEDIMLDVEEKAKELKDVALAKRSEIHSKLNALKTEFSAMFNLEETIDGIKQNIAEFKANINTKKEELKDANEIEKITINATLDALETALDEAEKTLDGLVKDYNEHKKEYEAKIDAFVKQVQQQSKTALENAKTEIKNAIEAHKATLNSHIEEFKNLAESAKNARIAEIEAYQNALNA